MMLGMTPMTEEECCARIAVRSVTITQFLKQLTDMAYTGSVTLHLRGGELKTAEVPKKLQFEITQ
jgi:hypothetical protein